MEWEGKGMECSYFLSSRLELGFFISINAQPNFYRKRAKKAMSFVRFCRKPSPEHSLGRGSAPRSLFPAVQRAVTLCVTLLVVTQDELNTN